MKSLYRILIVGGACLAAGVAPARSQTNLPPNPPNGPVPAHGVQGHPIDETILSWSCTDPNADPLTFDVYFGPATSPPLVASNHPTKTFNMGTLVLGTQYYWRIIARDPSGATTAGPLWTFRTAAINSPPNPPANPSPPDGATGISIGTNLYWTASDPEGQPLRYRMYFGTTPDPPLLQGILYNPAYAPPTLSRGTTYYWRVLVRDITGLTTLGPVWSFTTTPGNSPPGVPGVPEPPDGRFDVPRLPTLTWIVYDPDLDPMTYRVYLGTGPNPPLVASNLPSREYSPTLQYATNYRWRVVAVDAHGAETSGPEWTFTTTYSNRAPSIPSFPSPSNGAFNVLPSATLRWSSGDPDGDPVTFEVYLGTTNPPPLIGTTGAREFDPPTMTVSTLHYWRVDARDSEGAFTAGPTWTFTTKANSAPSAASAPWPPHLGASGPTNPTLTWIASDVDGQPLAYSVYFGTTSPPPLVATVNDPQFSPGPLQLGGAYFWRVDVSDGIVTTPGPYWLFTVRQPGDLVQDGMLTIADAQCAMEVALWNPTCGGNLAYTVGDVDCSGAVTPRDARCIHKAVIDGSCQLCDRAVAQSAPEEPVSAPPVVSVASLSTQQNTLVVRLAVSGVPTLEAFGFYTVTSGTMPMLGAARRGATEAFEVLEVRPSIPGTMVVGGYTLSSEPIVGTEEFIELYFDVSGGFSANIAIDGFVDDLAGASLLIIDLATPVGTGLPTHSSLHQNYPNPFNPQTTIVYDVARPGYARLYILDVAGRVVRRLIDREHGSGSFTVSWNGKDDRGQRSASGVYFYVLDVGGERRTRKMVLLK